MKDKVLEINLSDASKATHSGKKLVVQIYVTGKGQTPFIIPKKVGFACEGIVRECQLCTFASSRAATLEIAASDRRMLSLLGKADSTILKHLKSWEGVCDDCRVEVLTTQNVEELRVSPRLDVFLPSQEYVTMECYYLGHGLKANRPYEVECYCFPEPTTQRAVLVISKAVPLRDMIEGADNTWLQEALPTLQLFCGHPDDVFSATYQDFTSNVHRIVGREALQTAFDLVFHSVLQFDFQGVRLRRGWTECFVLGDSGQGKTEMSLCLLNHYGLGERIQGEGTSTAGLIGGLERFGDRWILVWGRVPQMDRKLLIIDEFAGISPDDVAKLSDIRSTGIAEITKIRTERASARTRLILMSNTRDGLPLGAYNTGVEALLGVFEHAEDVRRLDFALCVASGEVDVDQLNVNVPKVEHKYTDEACRNLILWVWSRTPEQVRFTPETEKLILQEAVTLSNKYSAFIPLVEPADARLKLARLSVACACRCFSADDEGNVIVLPEHVVFVLGFLERCYTSPYMAYDIYSDRAKSESVFHDGEFERASAELHTLPSWAEAVEVLEAIGNPFRGYEIAERLNLETYEVREIIHFLSRYNLIKTLPAGYRKLPKLNHFLRSIAG